MAASDLFKRTTRGPAGGPQHLALVVPNDAADLSHVSQWVYVPAAGTLRVTTRGGETLTAPVMLAGWHLIELSRIHATGTTASGIMAGW